MEVSTKKQLNSTQNLKQINEKAQAKNSLGFFIGGLAPQTPQGLTASPLKVKEVEISTSSTTNHYFTSKGLQGPRVAPLRSSIILPAIQFYKST